MSFKSSVLITGGTSGLGYYCAEAIARQHPECQVVIASRKDPTSAAASINASLGQENTSYLPLDLASLAQVRSFVQVWESQKLPPIRTLLLNAGLQFPEGLQLTDDGVEKTFAVNHVGHALLFHLLAPHLEKGARIVITSSGTHDPAQKSGVPDAKYTSAEELAHPPAESAKTNGQQRYSTSKLVNVLWTYALQKRLLSHPERQLSVVAFDPGLMPGTGLAREYSPLIRFVWDNILPRLIPLLRIVLFANIHTAKESGESLAWVALNDDVARTSGVYFEGRKEINSSIDSHNEKNQEDLWEWTVNHVALNEEEASKFNELR